VWCSIGHHQNFESHEKQALPSVYYSLPPEAMTTLLPYLFRSPRYGLLHRMEINLEDYHLIHMLSSTCTIVILLLSNLRCMRHTDRQSYEYWALCLEGLAVIPVNPRARCSNSFESNPRVFQNGIQFPNQKHSESVIVVLIGTHHYLLRHSPSQQTLSNHTYQVQALLLCKYCLRHHQS